MESNAKNRASDCITLADWKVVLPQFHQKDLPKLSIWLLILPSILAQFENKAANGKDRQEISINYGTGDHRSINILTTKGIPKNDTNSVTSTTEFVSGLFFTLTSLTRLAPEGRFITCSLCIISYGSGCTGKLFSNIFDMLSASSFNILPWQRPSICTCKKCRQKLRIITPWLPFW